MASKKQQTNTYPYWKVVFWRAIRTGIWGGVTALATVTIVLKPDLSNYKAYSLAVVGAFVAGFCNAGFMAIRDMISGGDKSAAVNKLPL